MAKHIMRMKRKGIASRKKMRLILYLCLVVVIIGISLLASGFVVNDPYQTNAAFLQAAPSPQFPFGTDKLGRCIFSRVLAGARASVLSSLLLVLITLAIGAILGILAGYYGGFIDSIIMRTVDILLAFPQMILAIAVAGILGGTMVNAMIALGFAGWTLYARLARGKVLSIKNEDYIHAARLSGSSDFRIMLFHILPNIAGELVVNASIQMGTTMLGFAGLSYLGLGVQVPQAEWGSMINEAKGYIQLAPWAVLAPGLALFFTVILFNLFGDALSDYIGIKETMNE